MTLTGAAPAAVGASAYAFHAGFDTDQFPGLGVMAWLKRNTNLAFTGYYLKAPSHPDGSWLGQRAALAAQGWGFMPVYVGQELAGPGSHLVSAAQGTLDGLDAAARMTGETFAPHSTCWLDLEDGAPFEEPRRSYVIAWALAFQRAYAGEPGCIGWNAGVYCSHDIAADVHAALEGAGVESPQIWAFKVATTEPHRVAGPFEDDAPAGCGFPAAIAWQHDQNALIDTIDPSGVRLLQVDLSTALYADPSAP